MGIRSMFSGVSGLQSHSTWLDVIGNNISNTNTVAYKASRVEFAAQISQQMSYASGSDAASGLGGVNGTQVGLGSRVQSIQTLFTQGTAESTGVSSDLMISGTGFLISSVGGSDYYTRAGNLSTDGDGYLVDANGGMIQGWSSKSTFTQKAINGAAGAAGTLYVTDASLKLDTTTSISNIQIKTGETCPAKATSVIDFSGNLDAANGGMLDLGAAGAQLLPFNSTDTTLNGAKAVWDGTSLQQNADFTTADVATASANVSSSVVENGISIDNARANATYIWNNANELANNPPVTFNKTVYDSNGLAHEITFECWQVNDLGDGGINDPNGANQAAYAWYAFDTTGGVKPNTGDNATSNLLGGTGIVEGYDNGTGIFGVGDLLYFNTDGSLASQGAAQTNSDVQQSANLFEVPTLQATNVLTSPVPTIGAEIMDMKLNFGTAGVLTQGQRDGLYGDAAGSYATVNGVSTYVPNQSASISSQDGYAEGTLESWSFDTTGKIQGVFSNSQTIVLGQLAMARVSNEEGLVSIGNGYYATSANSGDVYVGTAGTNGIGTTVGGELEGSNVDLTTELTNMIIAQRGFEANSQTIKVANETLQTVVNLGR